MTRAEVIVYSCLIFVVLLVVATWSYSEGRADGTIDTLVQTCSNAMVRATLDGCELVVRP